MNQSFFITTLIACLTLFSGCATDIAKNSEPKTLLRSEAVASTTVYQLSAATSVSLRSGFSIPRLKEGCEWRQVGSIPDGSVYRPTDWILMTRTGHAHEAYIVINGPDLVGIFMPVESAFVACRKPIPVILKEKR